MIRTVIVVSAVSKAALAASWHYSRLPVTFASEEGALRRRGPLGTRDAAANPLLSSMHRCRVFDSLAFLRLLSVVSVQCVCPRPGNSFTFYLSDQLIAGFRSNDSRRETTGNDGIGSRDDIGSTVNLASSTMEIDCNLRYRRGYSIHCE